MRRLLPIAATKYQLPAVVIVAAACFTWASRTGDEITGGVGVAIIDGIGKVASTGSTLHLAIAG